MNQDEFGEVINGKETYDGIAIHLNHGGNALIGWTDQMGTHFDILFCINVSFKGTNIQGGLRSNDLFVSIMRYGAFGFEINHIDTHPSYYAEKLFLNDSPTAIKITELINGVKRSLLELRK